MPQTLSPWWQEHLGDSWREIHDTRLHSLGNLTLTGYNAELSNGDFPSKRSVFINSPIHLSRSIIQFDRWDDDAIQERAENLAELALTVWPYFGPEDPISTTQKPGFTGKTPFAVTALGTTHNVTTWREVLRVTIETVQGAGPDAFDEVVAQFPRLFASKPEKFRAPRLLGKDGPYFETNLSAASVLRYCQQLVDAAGYSTNEWNVDTR